MSNHPNFDRAQAILDAVRKADYGPNFDLYSGDIVVENGPGAGPWHCARGKDMTWVKLVRKSAGAVWIGAGPGKNSLAAGQTQA